jgi:hypothetical protein
MNHGVWSRPVKRVFLLMTAACLSCIHFGPAATAVAATVRPLTPAGGLGRLEFKHFKMNDAGDFVAVSNTRVYIGNAVEGTVELLTTNNDANFVLGETVTIQTTTPPDTIYVYHDVFQTRLAINSAGDFVLASNNLLWLGNTRAKSIRQVADGGAFTGFQSVLISDLGYYLAVGYEKIFGGHVLGENAAQILGDAVGTFSVLNLYQGASSVNGYSGEQRFALNRNGQFVAMTASAVYAGSVADQTVNKILEERWGGFRHVSLADDGTFALVSDNDIYAGSLAD